MISFDNFEIVIIGIYASVGYFILMFGLILLFKRKKGGALFVFHILASLFQSVFVFTIFVTWAYPRITRTNVLPKKKVIPIYQDFSQSLNYKASTENPLLLFQSYKAFIENEILYNESVSDKAAFEYHLFNDTEIAPADATSMNVDSLPQSFNLSMLIDRLEIDDSSYPYIIIASDMASIQIDSLRAFNIPLLLLYDDAYQTNDIVLKDVRLFKIVDESILQADIFSSNRVSANATLILRKGKNHFLTSKATISAGHSQISLSIPKNTEWRGVYELEIKADNLSHDHNVKDNKRFVEINLSKPVQKTVYLVNSKPNYTTGSLVRALNSLIDATLTKIYRTNDKWILPQTIKTDAVVIVHNPDQAMMADPKLVSLINSRTTRIFFIDTLMTRAQLEPFAQLLPFRSHIIFNEDSNKEIFLRLTKEGETLPFLNIGHNNEAGLWEDLISFPTIDYPKRDLNERDVKVYATLNSLPVIFDYNSDKGISHVFLLSDLWRLEFRSLKHKFKSYYLEQLLYNLVFPDAEVKSPFSEAIHLSTNIIEFGQDLFLTLNDRHISLSVDELQSEGLHETNLHPIYSVDSQRVVRIFEYEEGENTIFQDQEALASFYVQYPRFEYPVIDYVEHIKAVAKQLNARAYSFTEMKEFLKNLDDQRYYHKVETTDPLVHHLYYLGILIFLLTINWFFLRLTRRYS